ncbi:MAG TPA: GspE/PulE family protein [Candidatus Saccharimonadales bacterium]|nr:GspE/PulE family protein [Candidatus Saccharimonadales bacterium]
MSVLSATTAKQVEEELLSEGLIKPGEVLSLKRQAEKEKVAFLAWLVAQGKVSDEALTRSIAKVTKIPYVNLSDVKVAPEVLKLLPQETAEQYMAVPLGVMQHRLVVAMLDADNIQAVDFLSNKIGRPLKVYAASEAGIRHVISQYISQVEGDMASFSAEQTASDSKDAKGKSKKEAPKQQAPAALSQDSPVSKILSSILQFAANNGASDIHMEPTEHELKIRCRIDGILREVVKLPKASEPAVVSRVKILSNLKIDEHRIPQDGQFSISVNNKDIDLRIAISPVVWGEQVVIRLLDKSGTSFKLEDMGYTGRALRAIREGLKQANGMILTSGPTGSGKSTSLYALLQEIKSDDINIVTLEDPVEYKMDGINQIQVNPEVGLTFATGLRSILRQDPDVVMVGEIRDKETATLAIQAALTGHLVFSTLHTNSAAGILPRLLDMGVEPFLIASTVHTVIGQRLVRRLTLVKDKYESDKAETAAVSQTIGKWLPEKTTDKAAYEKDLGFENLPLRGQTAYTLYKGTSSVDSPGGYKGRMGLYEVFAVTEKIQELILKRSTSTEIQKAAQAEQKMLTMREDGYFKSLAGMTTIAEVNRVASEDLA